MASINTIRHVLLERRTPSGILGHPAIKIKNQYLVVGTQCSGKFYTPDGMNLPVVKSITDLDMTLLGEDGITEIPECDPLPESPIFSFTVYGKKVNYIGEEPRDLGTGVPVPVILFRSSRQVYTSSPVYYGNKIVGLVLSQGKQSKIYTAIPLRTIALYFKTSAYGPRLSWKDMAFVKDINDNGTVNFTGVYLKNNVLSLKKGTVIISCDGNKVGNDMIIDDSHKLPITTTLYFYGAHFLDILKEDSGYSKVERVLISSL